ncbi:MAG: hypothetical protein FWE03_07330 [Firmicutes bacterium]|nr:hypothetical protein [Bacillota bacterium]
MENQTIDIKKSRNNGTGVQFASSAVAAVDFIDFEAQEIAASQFSDSYEIAPQIKGKFLKGVVDIERDSFTKKDNVVLKIALHPNWIVTLSNLKPEDRSYFGILGKGAELPVLFDKLSSRKKDKGHVRYFGYSIAIEEGEPLNYPVKVGDFKSFMRIGYMVEVVK